MTAVWMYPWSQLAADADRSVTELAEIGIDSVRVASHYHSIRTVEARSAGGPFTAFPGGAYFDPEPAHFTGTPLTPPVNEVAGSGDPLADVLDAALGAGIDVTAWTVCLHNTRLGSAYPAFRMESAFGTPHDHALCPSHPDVRAYVAGVVAALAEYDIAGIDLESVGFQSALHGHGAQFGHEKNYLFDTPTEEALVSQCFCDGCRVAAEFDIDRAREVVHRLCRRASASADQAVAPLADLVEEHPVLGELFEFRASVIERLVADVAAAADDVPVNYYTAEGLSRMPGTGWPAGVALDRLAPYLDRLTALCYVADPETAVERVRQLEELSDGPVDAGVTMDPEIVPDRGTWAALTERIADALTGELVVYNYSLLTDDHVDWLAGIGHG